MIGFFLAATLAHAQSFDAGSYFNAAAQTATAAAASPLDLLVESNSYVPPFYLGRPLASPGSSIVAQAIAHFTDQSGNAVPDSSINFTWKINGEVQGQLSGAGKSSAILPAPPLFGSETIEADAQGSGAYGTASETLSAQDPQPLLYQDHPLYGIEYYDALGGQSRIGDSEATFAAVPYFVAAGGPNDRNLQWTWVVNGQSVPATSSASSEITINAGGSAQVSLGVSLVSSANPLLDGQGQWGILFAPTGLQ